MSKVLGRILAPWVRVSPYPVDMGARLAASDVPVCYVLEHRSASDLAVLRQVCRKEQLPRPDARLFATLQGESRAGLR